MLSEEFKKSMLNFMTRLGAKNADAYENVAFSARGSRPLLPAPLVCLTESLVYVFIQTGLTPDYVHAEKKQLMALLDAYDALFSTSLEIPTSRMMVFAVNEETEQGRIVYYRRPFAHDLTVLVSQPNGEVNMLYELISTQEQYFTRLDSENAADAPSRIYSKMDFFKITAQKLDFASNDGERIKYDAQGNAYIRKRNNTWVHASTLDEQKMLLLATMGGFLGAHLFYQGRKAKGVLYLLTGGLFGVGWFFDSLELLFGVYKDKDGYYIIPPKTNPIQIVLCFLIGIALTFAACALLKVLLALGNQFINTIAESASAEWVPTQ